MSDTEKDQVDRCDKEKDQVDKSDKEKDQIDTSDKVKDRVDKSGKEKDHIDTSDKEKDQVNMSDKDKDRVDTNDKEKVQIDTSDKEKDQVNRCDKKKYQVGTNDKETYLVDTINIATDQNNTSDKEKDLVNASDKEKDQVDKSDKEKYQVDTSDKEKDQTDTCDKEKYETDKSDKKKDNVDMSNKEKDQVDTSDKENDQVDKSDSIEDVPHYRFLLIGKAGTGKSSTGNTLLGYNKDHPDAFKTGSGFQPTTWTAERKQVKRFIGRRERKITVVDTPDVVCLKVHDQVAEWKKLICPQGKKFTVLLTIEWDNRYTQENYDTYQTTIQCLGDLMKNNLVIVFTHCGKENYENTGLNDLMERNQVLNQVFQDAKERFVMFDNSVRNITKDDAVEVLLNLIDNEQAKRKGPSKPNSDVLHSQEKTIRKYCFLIIGSPGAGKSSTGNTILGYQKFDPGAFETRCSLQSITVVTSSKTKDHSYMNGVTARFTVVDTPNVGENSTTALKEDWNIKTDIEGHKFIVIYVIRCNTIYTPEDKETYRKLKKSLPERLKSRIIIGFTFFDEMDSEKDIRDILIRPSQELSEALSDAQGRYVIFNNNADDEVKREQVEALVDAVNFLEGNMTVKIGLLGDSEDLKVKVKERVEQNLKSGGFNPKIDLMRVPETPRRQSISTPFAQTKWLSRFVQGEITRHHVFLYVAEGMALKDKVEKLDLLCKISQEKKYSEIQRHCIIVCAVTGSTNSDGLKSAPEAEEGGPKNSDGLKSAPEAEEGGPKSSDGLKSAPEAEEGGPKSSDGLKSAPEAEEGHKSSDGLKSAPEAEEGHKSSDGLKSAAEEGCPMSSDGLKSAPEAEEGCPMSSDGLKSAPVAEEEHKSSDGLKSGIQDNEVFKQLLTKFSNKIVNINVGEENSRLDDNFEVRKEEGENVQSISEMVRKCVKENYFCQCSFSNTTIPQGKEAPYKGTCNLS